MNQRDHELADLLLGIEAEMRRISLWQTESPNATALASLMPFCHDTMAFEQWLRWVFLPRMKEVLEGQQDFPASSDIFPLAEYSLAARVDDIGALLVLIASFDDFINHRAF